MSGDLYFVRHGATILNDQGKLRSYLDVPLNTHGKAEANVLARYFHAHDVARVISSPLQRAATTARMIAQTCRAPIALSPLWRPWHLGQWAGESSAPLVPAMLRAIKTDAPPPGGEAFSVFRERVTKGLREAQEAADHADGDVIVVTHTRNVRLVMDLLDAGSGPLKLAHIEQKDDPTPPGGILQVSHDPGQPWSYRIVTTSRADHEVEKGYTER